MGTIKGREVSAQNTHTKKDYFLLKKQKLITASRKEF